MRNESLSALIKTLNSDGGKLAPKCAKLFGMLGSKVQEHENILHSKTIQESLSALHFATLELQAMRSVFEANGYVTKKDFRLRSFFYGVVGGVVSGLIVLSAVVYG